MFRFLMIPILFGLATMIVWYLANWGEDIGGAHTIQWRFPTKVGNVTEVATELQHYKEEHYVYVLTLFVAAYLYKQAFAIPGSFFLVKYHSRGRIRVLGRISAGLHLLMSTVGATICYFLADLFGKYYVMHYFGDRIAYFHQKIEENSDRLLYFLLFGRMFPLSPSWVLNIIAPFLDIPVHLFVLSVFIGLGPYNFICVQAGVILSELRSWDDAFNGYTMIKLSFIALIPLGLAILVRPRHQQKTIIHQHHNYAQATDLTQLITCNPSSNIDIDKSSPSHHHPPNSIV